MTDKVTISTTPGRIFCQPLCHPPFGGISKFQKFVSDSDSTTPSKSFGPDLLFRNLVQVFRFQFQFQFSDFKKDVHYSLQNILPATVASAASTPNDVHCLAFNVHTIPCKCIVTSFK